MTHRASIDNASAPGAPPRQLNPIVQRRTSTVDAQLLSSPLTSPTSTVEARSPSFYESRNSVVSDPLLAHHPQQQHKHHPSWAATNEQRAQLLARFPGSTRKHSTTAHKYSTSGASAGSRRTSISSVHSTTGHKLSKSPLRFRGASRDGDHDDYERSDGDDDSDDTDADAYAATMIHKLDAKRAHQQFVDNLGSDTYVDGNKVYRGTVDRRGITPAVTFTTTETPPSQATYPLVACSHTAACGFCSSTNLVWTLRCAFCGSARMSDVPRLKYLIDMALSVEPYMKPEKLAKKILDYAKFDRIAIKVEEKFKQASLVRAKTAIMMVSRTVHALRATMLRMIFTAWKGHQQIASQHEAIMHRLIKIKDIQIRSNRKELAFAMWKGHVGRILEERNQRFAIATRRTELTSLRRLYGAWQSFVRTRLHEKMEQMKQHYEAELSETPNEALREIERLKETILESRKLVFAATNTIFELLHVSLRKSDDTVLKTLQLTQMYPNTVGHFFESVHGHEILEGLSSGHLASSSNDFGIDDAKDDDAMNSAYNVASKRIEHMHPSESLIQWLNFQRKRTAEMGFPATMTDKPAQIQQQQPARGGGAAAVMTAALVTTATSSVMANSSSKSVQDQQPGAAVATPTTPSSLTRTNNAVKSKTKDKKHDVKEIKGLQDLRTSIASPNVMLKLLCHASFDAQIEHEKLRASEAAASGGSTNSTAVAAAAVAAESSTTATILSPAAQLQLKIYFKLVHRILNLPPDVISRDSFALNDFDSLYAFAVFVFAFHPNVVAPGLTLAPQHELRYAFLQPQWDKLRATLLDDGFDPFAQQQYYIFLAKLTRVNRQFVRFSDICTTVQALADAHAQAATRELVNDLSRRVLGKDSSISVALERETLASWVALSPAKVLALCDNDAELQAIERVFKDNVLDLIKIFRIYGSASGGKGLLEQEFLKVMTKAGVTDKKNMLRSQLSVIYHQARQPPPQHAGGALAVGNSSGGSSSSRDDSNSRKEETASTSTASTATPTDASNTTTNTNDNDDTDDRGATPNEFFEMLTRVAHHNFQKRRETLGSIAASAMMQLHSNRPSSSSSTSLSSSSTRLLLGTSTPLATTDATDSSVVAPPPTIATAAGGGVHLLAFVMELVVERVVPLTKKFQEQGLTFKKQMIHPDVQHVCKAQEKKLQRIFVLYAQKNKNPAAARAKLMDVSDFETLLKDRRLVDALFPFGRIKQLVAFVQQDAGGGSSSGESVDTGDSSEFVFAEFVEALAAIAVYRNANPYVPLAKKLEAFLDENF